MGVLEMERGHVNNTAHSNGDVIIIGHTAIWISAPILDMVHNAPDCGMSMCVSAAKNRLSGSENVTLPDAFLKQD